MNCQRCNTRIDYRFLTNCAHCDCEVERTTLSQIDSIPDLRLTGLAQKRYTWIKRLINLAYVFASSIAGMISGAVVVYFAAGIAYQAYFTSSGNPGADCARGTAIAFLSILLGAYLGTIGGTAFAVKRPLCKGAAN